MLPRTCRSWDLEAAYYLGYQVLGQSTDQEKLNVNVGNRQRPSATGLDHDTIGSAPIHSQYFSEDDHEWWNNNSWMSASPFLSIYVLDCTNTDAVRTCCIYVPWNADAKDFGHDEREKIKKILENLKRKSTIQLMTYAFQCIANASQKTRNPTFYR